MSTDARRNEIDKQRVKIGNLLAKLEEDLEEDGHDIFDCGRMCFDALCSEEHTCTQCREDGE
jgi:hypothetical protein